MEILELLDTYRHFLKSNWKTVESLCQEDVSDFFKQNWLQANWEMILESFLCQNTGNLVLLDYYGDGAEDLHYSLLDGQEGFDRVSLPSLPPTHTITCFPKNRNICCSFSDEKIIFPEKGLVFGEFTSFVNGKTIEAPPFDYVILLSDPFDLIVPFKDLNYQLTPIDKFLKK